MFNLVGKVSSVVFLVIVIALGIAIGVRFLPEGDGRSGSVDSHRYLLADRVAGSIAEAVRSRTDAELIAILPIDRDLTGEVTELLGEKFRGKGAFQLVDEDLVEDAIEEVLEDRQDKSITNAVAIDIGKRLGAHAVLLGRLDQFKAPKRGDPAEMGISVDVVDVDNARPIVQERFDDRLDGGFSYFAATMKESSGWLRLLVWILLTVTAPFASWFLVRKVTNLEKNAANLALLAGYTLFDLLVALFLVGFMVSGFWAGFLILLGFLAAGAYNFLACTIIYEMGK